MLTGSTRRISLAILAAFVAAPAVAATTPAQAHSSSCTPGHLASALKQVEAECGSAKVISAHRPGARIRGERRRQAALKSADRRWRRRPIRRWQHRRACWRCDRLVRRRQRGAAGPRGVHRGRADRWRRGTGRPCRSAPSGHGRRARPAWWTRGASWVGLGRGDGVAAVPFPQAARRTRRATFTATGSPRGAAARLCGCG